MLKIEIEGDTLRVKATSIELDNFICKLQTGLVFNANSHSDQIRVSTEIKDELPDTHILTEYLDIWVS